MYQEQFLTSRPCAAGLSGELCSWMYGLMQHKGCHSCGIRLWIDRSFDESYDITDLNIVSIFRWKFIFCFLVYPYLVRQYTVCWSLINLVQSLEVLHVLYDSCKHTDDLSCCTIWSLKSSNSWPVAKSVYTLLLPELRRQYYKFGYLYLRWRWSHHPVFLRIRFLFCNSLVPLYVGVKAYRFSSLRILNRWRISHRIRQVRSYVIVRLVFLWTQPHLTNSRSRCLLQYLRLSWDNIPSQQQKLSKCCW